MKTYDIDQTEFTFCAHCLKTKNVQNWLESAEWRISAEWDDPEAICSRCCRTSIALGEPQRIESTFAAGMDRYYARAEQELRATPQDAFEEGRAAGLSRKNRSDNPYPPLHSLRPHWLKGWFEVNRLFVELSEPH